MADIRISPESMEALKARLATPEGKEALRKLAKLIAETAVDAIPPELRESLATEEGMTAFKAAWPDIVQAFLFRGVEASRSERKRRTVASGARKPRRSRND